MVRQIFSDGETVSPPAVNRELLVRIQFGEPYQDIVFNGSTYALGVYRQGSSPCILTKWHCSSTVEHPPEERGVEGSTPSGATKLCCVGGVADAPTCKVDHTGSIPVRSSK